MFLAPIRSFRVLSCINPIAASGYVSRTNQSVVFGFLVWEVSNFNEVMVDSSGSQMELSFRMRNVGFSVFLTCILPRFMRNAIPLKDIRLPLVTVSLMLWKWLIVVSSCTRENGILCTVARWSWLLFPHDESGWKNFESNIAWGVDELHQTFWFEQFFNGKLCCKIHDLLSVPIIFFWIGLLGAISRWMSD